MRLLVLAEGKSQVASEIDITLGEWPRDKAESMCHLYLLQDSQAVLEGEGVAKYSVRVPHVGIQFQTAPLRETTSEHAPPEVSGEFVSMATSIARVGGIKPSEQHVVFYRYYAPRAGEQMTISSSDSVEALAQKAMGGSVVVVLTVEWR